MKTIRYRCHVLPVSEGITLSLIVMLYMKKRKFIVHEPYIDVDVPHGQASQRAFENLCRAMGIKFERIPKDFNV